MAAEGDQLDAIHHIMDKPIEGLPSIELFGIDMSITRDVVVMWLAAVLVFLLFFLASRDRGYVPGKFRSFFESLLLYLRDEVARPFMGHHGDKYIPYLWTTFFFILMCNYLGLVPLGEMSAAVTGNLSVTVGLTVISFLTVHYAGVRQKGVAGYLKDFVPPVPLALFPLMLIVEVVSHTTRTVALAVRLFANMMAGHVIILTLLGFIFLFRNYGVAVASVIGTTAFMVLEVLFGLIQAYVFTLLTAVFIGMALAEEH